MFSLNGMKQQARFFCVLGYQREKVIAQLKASYPEATAEAIEAAWDDAAAQMRESERQLDAAVRAEDNAAKRAEHDLSVSMHDADA